MWRQRFGSSADRDEAQYRRGAALGLTFGELFLLLAFVLLLLLGFLEADRRAERADAAPFEPMRKAVEQSGISPDTISDLLEAVGETGLEGIPEVYVAADRAGISPEKLAEVMSDVADWIADDFDMVRADLATGTKLREQAPGLVPEDVAGLDPATLELARTVPPGLDPDKLVLAFDIAAEADEPTVDAIRQALANEAALGGDVADAVGGALGPLVERTGGRIDPRTGSVTLPESVLFGQGSDALRPATRDFLVSFCGPWIATIHEFGPRIAELRIEGHSSSEWGGLRAGAPEAYLRNLDLSQRRSAAVLSFCLAQDMAPGIADWARQRLVAVGLSSSRPVRRPDGEEDAGRSRRVVFSFETDKGRVLEEIRTTIDAGTAAPRVPAPPPEPASDEAVQGPPRDRYDGPARVIEAGLLEVAGARLRLGSVDAPAPGDICAGPEGRDLPCGRIAAFRLAEWLGDSAVTCIPVGQGRDDAGYPIVHCSRGDEDVSAWLIGSGHADPLP